MTGNQGAESSSQGWATAQFMVDTQDTGYMRGPRCCPGAGVDSHLVTTPVTRDQAADRPPPRSSVTCAGLMAASQSSHYPVNAELHTLDLSSQSGVIVRGDAIM